MNKVNKFPVLFTLACIVFIGIALLSQQAFTGTENIIDDIGGLIENPKTHPLQITEMRKNEYPGSDLAIEQSLPVGSNYDRYIASYRSDGLKIYALLTIPHGKKPENGWPVVIFNHGYIAPTQYRTAERYIPYTDAFSRNGYILFRPDYRGHGNSEGQPTGAYGSNAYTIDVLNALATMKRYKDADSTQIGMWGHSMGGYITLRTMVISKDIKAGVIWAGVVASYSDLLNNWRRRNPSPSPLPGNINPRGWRQALVTEFGEPQENPQFWNSISATSFLGDISGPIQLHHGTSDSSVPIAFSEKLAGLLKEQGKTVELYTYPGDDHNIGQNLSPALQRSVKFFDTYLKSP